MVRQVPVPVRVRLSCTAVKLQVQYMQKCYDRILITYFLHSTLLLQGNANSRVGYCTVPVFKKLIRSEVSRLRDTGFPFILYSYMRPFSKQRWPYSMTVASCAPSTVTISVWIDPASWCCLCLISYSLDTTYVLLRFCM